MEIKEFWVVTKPTKVSTLVDICFKESPWEIGLQFLGGLKSNDIIGFFSEENEAKTIAAEYLNRAISHVCTDFKKVDDWTLCCTDCRQEFTP